MLMDITGPGNEAITSGGVLISQAVNSPGIAALLDWWRTVISISFSAGSHA